MNSGRTGLPPPAGHRAGAPFRQGTPNNRDLNGDSAVLGAERERQLVERVVLEVGNAPVQPGQLLDGLHAGARSLDFTAVGAAEPAQSSQHTAKSLCAFKRARSAEGGQRGDPQIPPPRLGFRSGQTGRGIVEHVHPRLADATLGRLRQNDSDSEHTKRFTAESHNGGVIDQHHSHVTR